MACASCLDLEYGCIILRDSGRVYKTSQRSGTGLNIIKTACLVLETTGTTLLLNTVVKAYKFLIVIVAF